MGERKKKERVEFACLHNSLNPSSLVIVLKADDSGVRNSEVSVKEEEMVSKHDEKPTGDQYQIKAFLFKTHRFFFFLSV